jgi:triosephosphate isomerase
VILVGTSWKMNGTRAFARAYVERLAALPPVAATLFVCPPFTALDTVRDAIEATGMSLLLGAQNCHFEAAGAHTGEISAPMLADAGCRLVELGHSERRADHGETDARVALKVRAVLDAGMRPLVCIGESADDRAVGAAAEVVVAQAKHALSRASPDERGRTILAYEPVWAIGAKGRPARPEDVAGVCAGLRAAFPGTPVVYGGSVDAANARDFVAAGLDGLFVGRAALTADGLHAIALAVAG